MQHFQHFYTIGLLIVSNIFMTVAWYGHLKLQQIKIFTDNTPLYVIILLSWMLAESLKWNHLAAFICLVMAVFFVFHKW